MNDDITQQLNNLKIEDFIWIIYVFIAIAALFSNNYEKNYLLTKNKYDYKTFHKINSYILTIAFFIYLYFVIKNYKSISKYKKNISNKKHFEATLLLISSILFLIAGGIALYLEIADNVDDEEIGI